MEDNSNNFSNFIRNRLLSVEDANDDWDKPDAPIWENAKLQILEQKEERKRALPFWIYGPCLAFVLLCSLFCNWQLVQSKNKAVEQFKEQSKAVAFLQEQLSQGSTMEEIRNKQNLDIIKKLQIDKVELAGENELIVKERNKSNQQYQSLFTISRDLENKITFPIPQKETKKVVRNLSKASRTIKHQSLDIFKLPSISLNPLYNPTDLEQMSLKVRETSSLNFIKIEKKNKSEFGFNFGYSFFRLPTSVAFDKKENNLEKTSEHLTMSYQLHYAYSVKNNWWLKTGIRYSNYSYANEFQFKTAYDKSKEFEKSDGTLANELSLQTSNGFLRTIQDVQMDIPQNTKLETGDWIFGEFVEQQNINAWQVPVGVEYRQGNNKLYWQIETGLLLNLLSISETNLDGKIQSFQSELPIEIINKTYDSSVSKLLFGLQGGIGLHYRFYKNAILRADALIQYNPHFLNQNIQIGLGYKF